jgi:hypothetical protein
VELKDSSFVESSVAIVLRSQTLVPEVYDDVGFTENTSEVGGNPAWIHFDLNALRVCFKRPAQGR